MAFTTLSEPLEWDNSTLLKGDVGEAVRALKDDDGGDLHVVGSSQLLRTLVEHDLVDGFRLMIDPLVLNGGKRFFGENGAARALRLVDTHVSTTGALLVTYERAEN